MNGELRPGLFFVHAQDDLNLHILHMFKGTSSLDMAHIVIVIAKELYNLTGVFAIH